MWFIVLWCISVRYIVTSADHVFFLFFFQAEDGIRDLVRSRGLGDVYKRQALKDPSVSDSFSVIRKVNPNGQIFANIGAHHSLENAKRAVDILEACLLYTSDAADERSSVDLGGRRIIKKKKRK